MNLVRLFSIFGLSIVALNFVGHMFSVRLLTSPLGHNASMTIFTSLSVAMLFITFYGSVEKSHSSTNLLFISTISQVTSLLLLFNSIELGHSFLLSSSPTTSIFILFFSLFLYSLKSENHFWEKVRIFLGPISLFSCFLFVLFFLTDNFFLLGYSNKFTGIGLSPQTLACFLLLSTSYTLKYTKFINLEFLNLGFSPKVAISVISLYSVTNFSLLFCTGNQKVIIGIAVQAVFLFACFFLIVRPFFKQENKVITVCAWGNQIKPNGKDWLDQEALFTKMGIEVSHGISPIEIEKIKARHQRIT